MYSEYKEQLKHFYNYQTNLFRFLGAYFFSKDTSKLKKIGYEVYSAGIFFFTGGYNLGLLIEFYNQPTVLEKIVNVFFVMITLIGSLFKQCSLRKDNQLYKDQAALLYKDIFNPIDSNEEIMFRNNLAMNKRVRNGYGFVSVCAVIYILLLQQISHPDELAIAVYCPFELNTSFRFMAMEIYGGIALFMLCLMNVSYDSWCTSFLVFANTQLQILERRLQRIGQVVVNDFEINAELKKLLLHHDEISKFVKKLEIAISIPVSVQIFCSIAALCCNFYSMSFASVEDDISNFVKFFIYQMAMFAQIFFFCYFANEVTLTSLKLPYALYSSNWINWNKTNRRLMMMTIQRFQNPILVRSINRCYSFHLTTFTSIVNTSYSYFALLKQMNN